MTLGWPVPTYQQGFHFMSMSCRLRSGKSLPVILMAEDNSSIGTAERWPQTVAASEAIQTRPRVRARSVSVDPPVAEWAILTRKSRE